MLAASELLIALCQLHPSYLQFAPGPAIPRGWYWFYLANPLHYGLEALVTPQFVCFREASQCPSILVPSSTGQLVPYPTGEYISSYFGLDYALRWRDVGILFGFIAGIFGLAALSLRYLQWVVR